MKNEEMVLKSENKKELSEKDSFVEDSEESENHKMFKSR